MAGQFRTVNISKGGRLFGLADFLEPSLQQVLTKLAAENIWSISMPIPLPAVPPTFSANLNAAHPFREGNGRMQREFIREQGLKAGHYIDWRAATAEEMIEASQVSQGRRVNAAEFCLGISCTTVFIIPLRPSNPITVGG